MPTKSDFLHVAITFSPAMELLAFALHSAYSLVVINTAALASG